jgi:hypothetical protein
MMAVFCKKNHNAIRIFEKKQKWQIQTKEFTPEL